MEWNSVQASQRRVRQTEGLDNATKRLAEFNDVGDSLFRLEWQCTVLRVRAGNNNPRYPEGGCREPGLKADEDLDLKGESHRVVTFRQPAATARKKESGL